MDTVTQNSQEMYNAHPFGDFSYGREAREQSDYHLLEFLRRIPSDKQLYDIGCGVGFWMETYHRLGISKEYITALDLAPINVQNLTQRGYKVLQGSVLELPFEDNVADNTICQGVIMMTSDPFKAFTEVVRITKPTGLIYISVYNKWHPYFYITYKATYPIRFLHWNVSRKFGDIFYPFFWLYFQVLTYLTMGSFLDNRSCKTIYMDQVIAPSVSLHSKADLQNYADKTGCELIEFGKSRRSIMLSAILRKR